MFEKKEKMYINVVLTICKSRFHRENPSNDAGRNWRISVITAAAAVDYFR